MGQAGDGERGAESYLPQLSALCSTTTALAVAIWTGGAAVERQVHFILASQNYCTGSQVPCSLAVPTDRLLGTGLQYLVATVRQHRETRPVAKTFWGKKGAILGQVSTPG